MRRDFTGEYVTIATPTERARAFIPSNLPPSPPIDWTPALRAKYDQALLALGRLDAIPTFLPEFSQFVPLLNKKEALLSSISEEKTANFEELVLFGLNAETAGENSDISEIHRLSTLVDWIWNSFSGEDAEFLSLMRKAHGILFANHQERGAAPGELRENQRQLSVTQPGNAAFIPPPPERIQGCLESLQRFIDDGPPATPFLVKAALAQAQLEMIQPFNVGNSRLARLVPIMLMRRHDVIKSPILVTNFYFSGHRREYFEALNGVRANGDWETWLTYFATAVASSAEQSFNVIQALAGRVREDGESIRSLGRPADSALQIFGAMVGQPMATSNWLVSKTGITPATVNKSLVHLEELGIIKEMSARKRNRVFSYKGYIEILGNGIEEAFV